MATDDTDGKDEPDTVTYQFEMDRDEWREWSNTVPRETALADRLRDLIRGDVRAATRSHDDMEARSVQLLAGRIRIRSTQALGAVRDDDDLDREKAVEELEEVIELANALEE